MNDNDRELLKDLKKSLKKGFHKDCLDAYLENPDSQVVTGTALKELNKVLHEAG